MLSVLQHCIECNFPLFVPPSNHLQEKAKQYRLTATSVVAALSAANAGWQVKEWSTRWQDPSCNGQMVKRVVNSYEKWLHVFYPTPEIEGEEEVIAYNYAKLAWRLWKQVFNVGMNQEPNCEDIEAFEDNCKNFVKFYLLAYTSKKLPFYMHLLQTHAGQYMRHYRGLGKFRCAIIN